MLGFKDFGIKELWTMRTGSTPLAAQRWAVMRMSHGNDSRGYGQCYGL